MHHSNYRSTTVPLPELLIEKPVGESLAADTDTLQYTIAAQLVQHQLSVNHAGTLDLVGDDATHKVRIGVAQVNHQTVQRFL